MTRVGYPDDSKRIAIVGRTGSGKTQAAVWHLSNRSFDSRPWVVFNFKGDSLIDAIPGAREADLDTAPHKPGIYICRPLPHEEEKLDAFLWQIWHQENTGVYFDEGYMVTKCSAFQALLTQGRSKNIPIICLTQRPVWISRFVWSESDFFQIFTMTNEKDKKLVKEFVPQYNSEKLGPYQSIYHDVGSGGTVLLDAVPDRDTILQTFRTRAPKRLRVI